MKALWAFLGVAALFVIVLLFAGGSYVSSKNQMVAKDQADRDLQPRLAVTVLAPGDKRQAMEQKLVGAHLAGDLIPASEQLGLGLGR